MGRRRGWQRPSAAELAEVDKAPSYSYAAADNTAPAVVAAVDSSNTAVVAAVPSKPSAHLVAAQCCSTWRRDHCNRKDWRPDRCRCKHQQFVDSSLNLRRDFLARDCRIRQPAQQNECLVVVSTTKCRR